MTQWGVVAKAEHGHIIYLMRTYSEHLFLFDYMKERLMCIEHQWDSRIMGKVYFRYRCLRTLYCLDGDLTHLASLETLVMEMEKHK